MSKKALMFGMGGTPAETSVAWNPSDTGTNITFANSNADALKLGSVSSYSTVRATLSQSSGARYFEAKYIAGGTAAYIGMAVTGGTLSGNYLGSLGVSSWSIRGTDVNGIFMEGAFTNHLGGTFSFATGDVLGIAIDLDAGKIWFAANNDWTQGGEFVNSSPATGTDWLIGFTPPLTLFPAVSFYATGVNMDMLLEPLSANYTYSPPAGFSAWGA